MPVQESSVIGNKWRSMLCEIKILHFKRQYRQCAQICEDLLERSDSAHSAYKTYLNFYAALSYERLARAMHSHATNRIATLESAEQHYVAALQTLALSNTFSDRAIPSATSGESIFEMLARHQAQSSSRSASPDDCPSTTWSVSSVDTASTHSGHTRTPSASSDEATPRGHAKIASEPVLPEQRALRLHTPSTPLLQRGRTPSPLPLKLAPSLPVLPSATEISMESPLHSPTSPHSTDMWLISRSKAKYNAHLGVLRDQLEFHLLSVKSVKEATLKIVDTRRENRAPASFWTLPSKTMTDDEKQRRIQEGRQRGWKRRAAFGGERAERIKTLCEQAMAEL
ncbi:MAG: hypothetical protein M1820_002937 [Bogoriella megaspora]|nr:MAG: hypothetical protein M1820_002937 [Bogoriella megaspora]